MKTAHQPAHRTSHHNNGPLAHDLESLKENVGNLRSDVGELVQTAVHAGKSGAAAVQDTASRAVEGVTDTISDGIKGLKKSSRQTVKSVRRRISDNPMATACIALGAGFALAKFIGRRGRAAQEA